MVIVWAHRMVASLHGCIAWGTSRSCTGDIGALKPERRRGVCIVAPQTFHSWDDRNVRACLPVHPAGTPSEPKPSALNPTFDYALPLPAQPMVLQPQEGDPNPADQAPGTSPACQCGSADLNDTLETISDVGLTHESEDTRGLLLRLWDAHSRRPGAADAGHGAAGRHGQGAATSRSCAANAGQEAAGGHGRGAAASRPGDASLPVLEMVGEPYAARPVFWVRIFMAIFQGVALGAVGIAFFNAIQVLSDSMWRNEAYVSNTLEGTANAKVGEGKWWWVGMLSGGGLAVGLFKLTWSLLVRRFPSHTPGFVAELRTLHAHDALLPLGLLCASALSIGSGASVGPEAAMGAAGVAVGTALSRDWGWWLGSLCYEEGRADAHSSKADSGGGGGAALAVASLGLKRHRAVALEAYDRRESNGRVSGLAVGVPERHASADATTGGSSACPEAAHLSEADSMHGGNGSRISACREAAEPSEVAGTLGGGGSRISFFDSADDELAIASHYVFLNGSSSAAGTCGPASGSRGSCAALGVESVAAADMSVSLAAEAGGRADGGGGGLDGFFGLGRVDLRMWRAALDARIDVEMMSLDGMSAAFGALVPCPYVSPLLLIELGWVWHHRRILHMGTIARVSASASCAYALYAGLKQYTYLNTVTVPVVMYEFARDVNVLGMGQAAVLGVVCGLLGLLAAAVLGVCAQAGAALQARIDALGLRACLPGARSRLLGLTLLPAVGGTLCGLLSVAAPLTLGDGSVQLQTVVSEGQSLGATTLVATLFVKMLAMGISSGFGFVGGQIFPVIFMGACAGQLAHVWVPAIPLLVAVPCGVAALPAALFPAVFSLTALVSAIFVLGGPASAPPFVAALVSFTTVCGAGLLQALLRLAMPRAPPKTDKPATVPSPPGRGLRVASASTASLPEPACDAQHSQSRVDRRPAAPHGPRLAAAVITSQPPT
uniref:Chloride channel protein n=1 Tax=Chlamydomonas euryale TaxID=1486919 RepID=A0A7R9V9N5_9CHLO|mmetsp:Transcript_2674/g.7207  ORF Transcript_2674/g.7207 Transcript_2674/m.7207 type:complete len:949 (+) Transcript_2674:398-3244(+)